MIKVYNFEGKTEEECRMNCYEQLDVYENEILSNIYEEDELFKIQVVKKSDIKDFINNYLKEVTDKMGLKTKINVTEEDEIFKVKMSSNNNPILIGKEGRTLTSLQNLLRQTIRNNIKMNIKVNLDASNYKAKQEKNFEYEVKQIINEVMNSKTETKLDSMNSYKRRIVHTIASNYYNIETESFGEEPNRYTIIRYVEK